MNETNPIKLQNPEDVEKLLALRRLKMSDTKLPPPDRTGMSGELKHPSLPSVITGWFNISPAKATAWLDYILAGFAFAHTALGVKVEKFYEALLTGQGLLSGADYVNLRKKAKLTRPLDHLRQFLTSPESALFSKAMNRAIAEVTLQVIYSEVHNTTTQALEQSEVGTNWFRAKLPKQVSKIKAMFTPALRAAA